LDECKVAVGVVSCGVIGSTEMRMSFGL
jgi:hypothetical protein